MGNSFGDFNIICDTLSTVFILEEISQEQDISKIRELQTELREILARLKSYDQIESVLD